MKRILGFAAAAAVVAFSGVALGGAVSPQAASATVSQAPAVISATPANSGDLHTGNALRLFVTLDETAGTGIVGGTASVTVNRNPVTSRSGLASWFAGTSQSGSATAVVARASTPVVAAGVTQTITVAVPASTLHLGNPGIYAVDVTVRVAGKTVGASHTAVAWNLAGARAVPVTVAAPLTVPASSATFLSAKTLELDTAPGGVLTEQLADLSSTSYAIGIDPRIIASIRVLGKSAPASARDWLLQLAALPNQTFPLAWADSDVAAELQAGEKTVLGTKSLDYAIDPSLFAGKSAQGATPAATPTADPSDPTLPTSASLTAWNYTMPALSWPVENSLVTDDVSKLAASGLTGAIVSSGNVKASSGSLTGASGTIGGTAIAVSDSTASQYFRDAAAATTRQAFDASMTRLITTLGLISRESGSSPKPVLLTLNRDWENTDTSFARATDALTAHPWATSRGLSDVLASTPTSLKIVSSPESATRIASVRELLTWERREVRFSAVASNPEALTSTRRLSLLSMLSAGWFTSTSSWTDAVAAYVKETNAIVQSVQVQHSSLITLLADQTSIPVTLSNSLDQPVTVYLEVRPTRTTISVDKGHQFESVTIAANSQRRVQVPIQSLANGKAVVSATLYDQSRRRVSHTTLLSLNVQAGWETFGTAVFAIVVVAVFAFGIIRNIRRRRKANRAAEESDADVIPEDEDAK